MGTVTHPAIRTGSHRVSHPGAEAGPHGPNGDGVTDPRQLPTAWEAGTGGDESGGWEERKGGRARMR